jgi:excisionase family DNA binding protein
MKTLPKEKDTYLVAEIARLCSVSEPTVRVWINTGKLWAHKLPGSGAQCIIRVWRDDLEDFLKTYELRA